MNFKTSRFSILATWVVLLSATTALAGPEAREVGTQERHIDGTSHVSQGIPTGAAPTSQAVPTSSPSAAVPTPALTQVRMRTIFDFEKELELNETQVKQLKEAVAQLTAKLKENQSQLNELATTLNVMIRKDASEPEVKTVLEKIATLQVNGQLTDIRTTGQVNSILTPQQKERWIGIQIGDRAHFTK